MDSANKPFISIIAPCYNEEAILELNINTIIKYMEGRDQKYQWEILIINDGSKDATGAIARCGVRSRHHACSRLRHA